MARPRPPLDHGQANLSSRPVDPPIVGLRNFIGRSRNSIVAASFQQRARARSEDAGVKVLSSARYISKPLFGARTAE